ncbi:MFS transporter [Streptosporangiaceae bacterium NEAU-GS5]|nr:MFS transporter [Streptosporangiaceae bacterium NEAU-GS5]
MGMWSSGLPGLNDRLHLGPARLGTSLLLVSAGALGAMLLSGRLVDRWSSRRVSMISGPACGAMLIGPALAPSYGWLTVLAVVFGAGIGVVEVGINTHSVEVEQRYGRPIISAFHGTWSLGGAVGGGLTTIGLKAAVPGQALLVAAAIVIPFLYLPIRRLLLPPAPVVTTEGEKAGGVPIAWGMVVVLGIAAFAAHLSEGAAMDWAALHARWVLKIDPALAPLAFTIFSVAMTAIRLLGDPIRARLGAVRTIGLAGTLATTGYALVLGAALAPESLRVAFAWTGWGLTGVGLATVIPVLFSAVGSAGGEVGRAIAMVSAFGYTGLLAGPAILGFVAESSSLPVALLIPAGFAAVIAIAGVPSVRALTTPRAETAKVSTYQY